LSYGQARALLDEHTAVRVPRTVDDEIARRGMQAGLELVRALMRELDLVACQPRPWRPTTTVAGEPARFPIWSHATSAPSSEVRPRRHLGWVPWPFTDWKPADDSEQDDLLGGRFRVTEAIQFSNSGGVYLAEDTENDDRVVVLKEARPHSNINPRLDHDAVDILNPEWMFLNRLADVGSFPAPITKFTHWEHQFIAEEFLEGIDMRSVLLERNPRSNASSPMAWSPTSISDRGGDLA
jgi:hypothetical protein